MLIDFEVENFRSIREPAELSMVAVDTDREAVHRADKLDLSLLPVAGIFGANASGKSNVLAALIWLRDAVNKSLSGWEDEIPIEPFVGASLDPTAFAINLLVDGVRFEYVLELDRHAVRYEGLFHYPESRARRIFEREADDLKLQRGMGQLAGVRQLISPRVLALSAARKFDETLTHSFTTRLLAMPSHGVGLKGRSAIPYWKPATVFKDPSPSSPFRALLPSVSDRARAVALLRLADLGIDDVRVIEEEPSHTDDDGVLHISTSQRVEMLHRMGTDLVPFGLEQESTGTRAWYEIIGPVLGALRVGSVMVLDELGADLHPALSAEVIRLFHDPATNPYGAQIIFTSHDVSLLNVLNRDEIWLTEKVDGVTRLGPLSDFNQGRTRRSQDLERAYLAGRFGAVPDVDNVEFLRANRLIG